MSNFTKFNQLPMNAVFRIVGKDSTIYKKVGPDDGKYIDIYLRDLGRFINPPTDTKMHADIHKKLEKYGFQAVPRQEFEKIREQFMHPKHMENNVFLGEVA
jgi:hypothetical protein